MAIADRNDTGIVNSRRSKVRKVLILFVLISATLGVRRYNNDTG